MEKKNYISICADDFGITEKVDKSIINLILNKRLTETSCIVLTQNFKNSSKELKRTPREFGKGIHLTLTDFNSLTSPKTFTNDGKFLPFKNLFFKILKKEILNDEIIKEINAQLDFFEELMGTSPDFIDGHHHVHQLPIIRDLVFEILKKRYKNNLPWIRNTSESSLKILKRNVALTKTYILSFYGLKLKKKANEEGFRTNDGFSGIYNFSNNTDYKICFINFIKFIENNHLLMVHPGESDENLKRIDSVTHTRNLENDFLRSNDFLDILRTKSILLRPFHTTID
tara:strand:- start:2087 stop:2941 length:855 start_codon:yes stop_codon:yes gene_type:complete